MMKIVCLWSGPRNISTALMYSFAQRADTRVLDEPLYGHYLRVSGAEHPGRDEVLEKTNCDGDSVMREIMTLRDSGTGVLFIKHMAHHLLGLDLAFLSDTLNVFLVRDPREMLPSLTMQIPHAGLADTGLKRQAGLLDELEQLGQSPAVVDSRELLLDTEGVLDGLCQHIGIPFNDRMLRWDAGPIAEDGIWARHWYHAVHQSTGFSKYVAKTAFASDLEPLLLQCRPYYERLYARAIKARQIKEI